MAFPLCQLSVAFTALDQPENQLRFTLPPSYETAPDAGVFAYTEALPLTQWGPASRYKATIQVTRYYGTHQERSQQMAVGLMPQKALLLFFAGDCDDKATGVPYAPEVDRVFFNGRELGTLTGEDNLWILNTFEIPCEEINFPSSPGDIGKNDLEIIVDSANSEKRWKLEIYSMALQIRAPWPIFLVHGWTPNGGALEPMRNLIRSCWGIPCELGNAPMDNSPQTNGGLLDGQLMGHSTQYRVSKFNLIAHSKGGLDSRVLIDTAGNGSSHVNELHQIATPNAGSYLANILAHPKNMREKALSLAAQAAEPAYRKITPGLLSLTPENCQVFNGKFCSPVAPIATITGRIGNGHQYSKLGHFSYGHDFNSPDWGRQGDGIVSVNSAHALRTQVQNSPLTSLDSRYAHNQIILDGAGDVLVSFSKSLLALPDSVIPKNPDLRSAIASATSGPRVIRRQFIPATAIEAIQKALEAMPPPAPVELRTITPSFQPDHISIKDAIVEPGQVVELRFDLLENTEHAAFLCTRTTPDTRVTLIHPDGTALTFPEPPSLAEDEVASLFGVRMLEVANLPKGIYIVRVENSSPSPICVTASCQFTGIAPEVRIRLDEEQRQIVAWLERSDEVVQTDNLPLRCLYWPCSSLGNTDDEQMPSAAEPTPVALTYAGNGRYTADLPELLEGEYEFRAEWLDQFGEAASEAEVRYGNYLVTGKLRPLNDPGTKIPGPYTDYCFSPPNKLLLCKGIRIGIDATVSRPGDYAVTASLCDKNGTELAQGFCHQSAPDAGALHFDLEFDCGQVYALEIDGPYLLQDITLEYLPENATPKRLDVIASHQTASFRWQDFDTQPFRITDDVQDWLETVNSDGRETSTLLHIRFHVQVPVTIENNFAFSATLRTSTGQTIRSVEAHPDFQGPEDLTSGLWPVEMVFDTGDLLDTEVPGPYTLFNICAHRKNPSEYLPLEDEIETRAYQLDQFAYPMTTLAMNDYPGLEIKTTPFPDHPDTHMATLVITRQDNNPNDTSFLKYGDPLEGPFGIGLLDDDFTSGFQIVGAQTIELKAGKCQYLDCNDEVLRQLQDQGNHDDCLDDGETITLSFQYTCANGLGFTPPPIALLGRMRAPLGYHRHRNITAKCLSTDLDQNFQISDAEAAAARSKWEEGDLSHHILLQTLEFHQAPGYRFNPLLNDFEPLENGEAQ